MKQILFVIDSLGCGGAEKSLISLLPLIDYKNYNVDLLIVSRGRVFEKYVPMQVHIVPRITYNSFLKRVGQICFSLQLRLNKTIHPAEIMWKCMNKSIMPYNRVYDVAIAYQQGFPTFFVSQKVTAKKKIAWINADVYKAGYDMNWCRQFYKKMDHIILVSSLLKDKLCDKLPEFKDKYHCVYDVINPELICSMAEDDDEDLRYFDHTVYNIVTVGRLVPPKNHILAVDTAAILDKKGINFKWFFVGEGEMRKSIEKRISENCLEEKVILLGMKENPYPFIKKADIYVQTSTFEGFGLTIAEAKILGKPIISTNFDVVNNQIKDGENGLIAHMTPNSVSAQILRLIKDSNLRDSLASKAGSEKNFTSITEPQKVMQLFYDN